MDLAERRSSPEFIDCVNVTKLEVAIGTRIIAVVYTDYRTYIWKFSSQYKIFEVWSF